MNIAIIGTGYVGLTTGACLSHLDHKVVCVDIDEKKIENLKKGIIPIYEPGLEEMVKEGLQKNTLSFTTNSKDAIEFAEVVFSAVGTPMGKDFRADLEYVKIVASEFGKYANSEKIFVNKSTVPVGTADLCKEIINLEFAKRNVTFGFEIVSNPEFLREGTAVNDTLHPDRIVIGSTSKTAQERMKELYAQFLNNENEILFTDLKSAEIIKYASNSFLATKISFINELANFCEDAGGNIKDIAKGMGLDKRIGKAFLNAGIGYGGSCLPKDVKALIKTGEDLDHEFTILKAVEEVNEKQKLRLIKKLEKHLPSLEEKTIAILGLAFKPETDDVREAPSLNIIKALQSKGAHIQAYDPQAGENAKSLIENFNVNFSQDPYEATKSADALLVLTEWAEFKTLDFSKIKSQMKNPLILDGRNCLDKKALNAIGFTIEALGEFSPSASPLLAKTNEPAI